VWQQLFYWWAFFTRNVNAMIILNLDLNFDQKRNNAVVPHVAWTQALYHALRNVIAAMDFNLFLNLDQKKDVPHVACNQAL
jgi:hypothetical protein